MNWKHDRISPRLYDGKNENHAISVLDRQEPNKGFALCLLLPPTQEYQILFCGEN